MAGEPHGAEVISPSRDEGDVVDDYFRTLGLRRCASERHSSIRSAKSSGRQGTLQPLILDKGGARTVKKWEGAERNAAEVLQCTAYANQQLGMPWGAEDHRAVFLPSKAIGVTITAYFLRLVKCVPTSWPCILFMIHTLARSALPFTPASAHRLIAAAVMTLVSCEEDEVRAQAASLTGLPRDLLARLEIRMTECLRRAHPRPADGGEVAWDDLVGMNHCTTIRTELPRLVRWHQRNVALAAQRAAAAGLPLQPGRRRTRNEVCGKGVGNGTPTAEGGDVAHVFPSLPTRDRAAPEDLLPWQSMVGVPESFLSDDDVEITFERFVSRRSEQASLLNTGSSFFTASAAGAATTASATPSTAAPITVPTSPSLSTPQQTARKDAAPGASPFVPMGLPGAQPDSPPPGESPLVSPLQSPARRAGVVRQRASTLGGGGDVPRRRYRSLRANPAESSVSEDGSAPRRASSGSHGQASHGQGSHGQGSHGQGSHGQGSHGQGGSQQDLVALVAAESFSKMPRVLSAGSDLRRQSRMRDDATTWSEIGLQGLTLELDASTSIPSVPSSRRSSMVSVPDHIPHSPTRLLQSRRARQQDAGSPAGSFTRPPPRRASSRTRHPAPRVDGTPSPPPGQDDLPSESEVAAGVSFESLPTDAALTWMGTVHGSWQSARDASASFGESPPPHTSAVSGSPRRLKPLVKQNGLRPVDSIEL
eukprot:TRINITY_DN5129_c0_g4_i1.p1 TRINITY_DN5129_c0_g4~~TRINITY_DN5129_c0_g4_i1.p1  ORF type:complete len:724 (+),score=151.29 TRINITY_DN5129_c0_g4_i1:55-2172(+)